MKKKYMSLLWGSAVIFSMSLSTFPVMAEEAAEISEAETSGEEDFLSKIQGTYIELFPELSREEFRDIWLEETGAVVGEENAEAATDMLIGMCTADIYGQEAIDAYGDGSEGMAFDCYFLGGVSEFTIDGNIISGTDIDGNEIFRHAYDYVKTDENGFYLYESSDDESGQFTYFSFAPDTMDETYHLEFRYAEDEADLESWFEGNYAYWNAAAIAKNFDEEMVTDAIHLFATENLSEES